MADHACLLSIQGIRTQVLLTSNGGSLQRCLCMPTASKQQLPVENKCTFETYKSCMSIYFKCLGAGPRCMAGNKEGSKKYPLTKDTVLATLSSVVHWQNKVLYHAPVEPVRLAQTSQHSKMTGLMMQDSLLVTRILDYAARWHPEQVEDAFTAPVCICIATAVY